MQGKKNYQEKLFTSFQLSDRVPEGNLYLQLKERLELNWLYAATASYYGKEGQQSIDPVVFFKLILIGYLENLNSDRRIINTVSMRMDMLYFIGYDIDESLPWHSTLSRTRQLYSTEIFKQLFRKVLEQCIAEGMVGGSCQAIDSVFVKANASKDSMINKKILEDGDAYADGLQSEEGYPYNKGHVNATYYSPTDPDARLSRKRGKPSQLNYRAQVSVDTASYVITNMEAQHSDKRDHQCLVEMLDTTVDHLKANGLLIEEIVADSGYSSASVLEYLEDNHITGYIPNFQSYKSDREGFIYNEQEDEYTCSQGVKLVYNHTTSGRLGRRPKKVYVSDKKSCLACPLRNECIKSKSPVRMIAVTVDKPLFEKMNNRLQTRKGKYMMTLRKSTVEPVLGTLVNFLGMRRVNTIGIKQAGKCMVMAAVAYNLKKLIEFCAPKIEVNKKVIEKWQRKVQKMLFQPLNYPQLSYSLNNKFEKEIVF